jgi:hypothetical protein
MRVCGLGIVVRKPDLQGLDRAVEFVNSIETLADVFAMVSCQAIRAVRTAFLAVWRSMSVLRRENYEDVMYYK